MSKNARSCGDCTLCCTVMAIYELDKPRGVACKNLCPTGCAVYGEHPTSCKEFECLWLLAGTPMFTAMGAAKLFPRADRPDALDVVFTTAAGGVRHPETGKMYKMIIANEARPGAATTGRGAQAIERLLQNGYAICVNNDKVLYRVYYPDGVYYDVPPDSDDAKLHDPRTTSPEAQAELDRKTAVAELEMRGGAVLRQAPNFMIQSGDPNPRFSKPGDLMNPPTKGGKA